MDVYGPLRAALFIYEFLRLLVLIALFVVVHPLHETAAEGIFPYTVYVVPNALFPLMTYFLWIRLSVYKPYIALYMAGKTIGLVSIIGGCIFSFPALIHVPSIALTMDRLIAGVVLIVAALDGLTIFSGLMLNSKLKKLET
jgi:hypothetical protein